MSLFNLSASGAVILFTTVGLPSAGTALTSPISTTDYVSKGAPKGERMIRITDSLVEVTGGPNHGTIRIITHERPRSTYEHPRQRRQGRQSQSSSRQSTNRADESYRLTVETTARSLNATLKIDGETIKTLTSASETITLSPYLSTAGSHTIEIVGSYSPSTANTQILLVGPGTRMSQQVSGSGRLRQTLRVSVP